MPERIGLVMTQSGRVSRASSISCSPNGVSISRDFPGNWLFPSTSGYAATLADNGNVLSSYDTGAGLTVTLPSTTALSSGWSMGFTAENGKSLAVAVNGTSGGHLIYPNSGAAVTSLSLAGNNYEFITLQYDGSGNFRIEQATPATATQLGMAGIGGISRWSFPSVSTYNAALADNGNAISAYNSPLGYLTVTLPSTTAPGATPCIQPEPSPSRSTAMT